jgi:hypothetical protein
MGRAHATLGFRTNENSRESARVYINLPFFKMDTPKTASNKIFITTENAIKVLSFS